MRGPRKTQALALLALAAVPPPAHGSDFSLALMLLSRGAGLVALCLCAAWWIGERYREQ
ncbi:hypothetical protein K4L06_14340 [Lysobacter sp. BMK333-48F3]|uniref:hypothetical protein n=1 Tax=Lysobacter sp. BMK333-48F3 TaxID=2867962 RepID=UPI001C8B82BE|nr:hypothetical protein [Lysobacter sp. BMK333-48F3]MBX9402488.1 hypothetical protein [Lysobacter sp. BMK333-48F3]